jgi:hypothetical protein
MLANDGDDRMKPPPMPITPYAKRAAADVFHIPIAIPNTPRETAASRIY